MKGPMLVHNTIRPFTPPDPPYLTIREADIIHAVVAWMKPQGYVHTHSARGWDIHARHAVTRDFWAGQAKGSEDSGANDYTKFREAIGQVAVLQQQPIGRGIKYSLFLPDIPCYRRWLMTFKHSPCAKSIVVSCVFVSQSEGGWICWEVFV